MLFTAIPVLLALVSMIVVGPLFYDKNTQFGTLFSVILPLLLFIVAPYLIHVYFRGHAQAQFTSLTWYLQRTGWTVDVATDAFLSLPKHMLSDKHLLSSVVTDNLVARKVHQGLDLLFFSFAYHQSDEKKGAETATQTITALQCEIPGGRTVPGWVVALPTGSHFMDFWKDKKLESNEFNRAVFLDSEPRNLATQIFSPDFMARYLDEAERHYIHIEGHTVTIVFDGNVTFDQLDEATDFVANATKHIRHSGGQVADEAAQEPFEVDGNK